MFTELQQQFIEVCTKQLYDIAAPPETRCGWCAYSGAIKGTHRDYLVDQRIGPYHDFSVRRPEEDQNVPVEYRDQAIYLLAAVETLNGPLTSIVEAASRSVSSCTVCGEEKTARGGDLHCSGDCDDAFHDEPDGCHAFAPKPFDPAALFRIIAREWRGIAKVSEEFGQFGVKCLCGRHTLNAHPFTVPRLTEGVSA